MSAQLAHKSEETAYKDAANEYWAPVREGVSSLAYDYVVLIEGAEREDIGSSKWSAQVRMIAAIARTDALWRNCPASVRKFEEAQACLFETAGVFGKGITRVGTGEMLMAWQAFKAELLGLSAGASPISARCAVCRSIPGVCGAGAARQVC